MAANTRCPKGDASAGGRVPVGIGVSMGVGVPPNEAEEQASAKPNASATSARKTIRRTLAAPLRSASVDLVELTGGAIVDEATDSVFVGNEGAGQNIIDCRP